MRRYELGLLRQFSGQLAQFQFCHLSRHVLFTFTSEMSLVYIFCVLLVLVTPYTYTVSNHTNILPRVQCTLLRVSAEQSTEATTPLGQLERPLGLVDSRETEKPAPIAKVSVAASDKDLVPNEPALLTCGPLNGPSGIMKALPAALATVPLMAPTRGQHPQIPDSGHLAAQHSSSSTSSSYTGLSHGSYTLSSESSLACGADCSTDSEMQQPRSWWHKWLCCGISFNNHRLSAANVHEEYNEEQQQQRPLAAPAQAAAEPQSSNGFQKRPLPARPNQGDRFERRRLDQNSASELGNDTHSTSTHSTYLDLNFSDMVRDSTLSPYLSVVILRVSVN